MKRKKEVLAIAGICTLVVGLIVVIGLIVTNLVKETSLGNKVGGFFSDSKVNSETRQEINIEKIPYEEIFYYPFKGGNGLWGYVDAEFNEVISPQYLSADPFKNGVGAVRTENGYGFINKDGELVIKDKYFYLENFSDGVAFVSEDYDSNENLIINLKGEVLGSIHKKYGYEAFEDDTAVIYYDEKGYLINKKGDIILKLKDGIINKPVDGIRLVSKSEDNYFYVDRTGEVIGKSSYYYASDFNNGYGIVEDKNYNATVIDKKGNEIEIPSNFDVYNISSDGIIVADKNTFNFGLVDYNGDIIIDPVFSYIYGYNEGVSFARVGIDVVEDRLCVINNKGEILFDVNESTTYYTNLFNNGVSVLEYSYKESGVINSKGEVIIPKIEASIHINGNFIEVYEGEAYSYIAKKIYNLSGELLYEGKNDVLFYYIDDEVMLVENQDDYSAIMINKSGKQLKI